MLSKRVKQWVDRIGPGKDIMVSKGLTHVPDIYDRIVDNLTKIDVIKLILVTPDKVSASSELDSRTAEPISDPGHPTATGITVLFLHELEVMQFLSINSTRPGYGQRMVDATLRDFPPHWKAQVFFEWSHGFWGKMKELYKNINWLEIR